MLDQPGGGGPGAVDAADREAVGAAGLRHSARALPPHPEAHPPGGRCPRRPPRALCAQCVPATGSAISGEGRATGESEGCLALRHSP